MRHFVGFKHKERTTLNFDSVSVAVVQDYVRSTLFVLDSSAESL